VVLSDGSRKYVWGLGFAYSVDTSGAISVGHADGLGSVRALTDGAGNLVQTYLTEPFGAVLSTGGSSTQPFRFTGEQRDDTGLYYLRARFYDPVLGRFLSRDSFAGSTGTPLSLDRYSYVQNNPVVSTDPTGRCVACLVWGLRAALSPAGRAVLWTIAATGVSRVLGDSYVQEWIRNTANTVYALLERDPGAQIRIIGPNGEVIDTSRPREGHEVIGVPGPPPEQPSGPEDPKWGSNWREKAAFIIARLAQIIVHVYSMMPHLGPSVINEIPETWTMEVACRRSGTR